ncbi:MAG TPA: TonB-dependent receptor plug domain-containing protein, partial [Gemmatimonadales bacterium]|nr:TonB-dependent receptor plug domain-containing protein [Gemmatimonadales bacterium]
MVARSRKASLVLVAGILAGWVPATLAAQGTGVIRGAARLSADSAAAGALVVLRGVAGYQAKTDADGQFVLSGIPAGSYVVVATVEGRQAGTAGAIVHGGDTVSVLLVLGAPVELEGIAVTAPRSHGYQVDSASGASKIAIPILKLPQSVEVVSRAVLEDRAMTDFRDIPQNVSGVIAAAGYLGGGLNDLNYIFRGLPSSYTQTSLRDGFRDFSGITPRDVAAVDRIEFLKGPSSVLYGATGALGGMASTSTKQPLPDFQA